MFHLWRAWSPLPGLSSEPETKESPEEEIIKYRCRRPYPNRWFVLTTDSTRNISESTDDYLRLGSSILQRKPARKRMGSSGHIVTIHPGPSGPPQKYQIAKWMASGR